MEMQAVTSGSIAKVGYDPQTRTMIVMFNTGSTYEVTQVDQNVYDTFMLSPSMGSFYAKNIKDKFNFKKII